MAKNLSPPVNFDHPRVTELFEYLMRITAGEYELLLPVTDARDELDAIAHAVNVVVGELGQEKNAAEQAMAQKSRFLASMSHEIRTPITAILGYSELFEDGKVKPAERKMYIDRIRKNCSHLLGLIDSLMDLSKVESGHLNLNLEETVLRAELETIAEFCEMKAQEKGLSFRLEMADNLDYKVEVDKTKLRQIILNLANNAIKYTEKGEVVVRCFKAPIGQISEALAIEVEDTGIGIPDGLADHIFEAFHSRENEVKSKCGGVGLGLSIAKSIAQFMGGNVILKQTKTGKGSVFLFYTPVQWIKQSHFKANHPMLATGKNIEKIDGKLILLVEDSPDLSDLFKIDFERAKAKVTTAFNGKEALAIIQKQNFDAIVMDLEMPVLDGLATCKEMRANGIKNPIVMLTAHNQIAKHKACIAAGANEVLTKPISSQLLIQILERILAGKLK